MDDPTLRFPQPSDIASDEPDAEPPVDVAYDTPEADAIEQQQSVVPDEIDDELETLPAEASEADALDQSRVVQLDDDYDA